jgi:MFS family permease
MMMLFAPVSSRLMRQVGAKRTLMAGATVLGLGYLVALVLMDAPWQLLVASCVASAGVGIGYAAMPTLVLDAVPPREAASAVGVNALMRSMGTTLAAAAMGTVLAGSSTTVAGHAIPSEGAFHACFLIGAAAAFVGVAITAAIPRKAPEVVEQSPVAAGAQVG